MALFWHICSAIDFNCASVRQDCDLYSSLYPFWHVIFAY